MTNNNNAPFYVGQRVVCVDDGGKDKLLKKGDVFFITELAFGLCKCNRWVVRVGDIFGFGNGSHCSRCDERVSSGGPLWFNASRFAPIEPRHQNVEIDEAIIEQAQELINTPERVAPVPTPLTVNNQSCIN